MNGWLSKFRRKFFQGPPAGETLEQYFERSRQSYNDAFYREIGRIGELIEKQKREVQCARVSVCHALSRLLEIAVTIENSPEKYPDFPNPNVLRALIHVAAKDMGIPGWTDEHGRFWDVEEIRPGAGGDHPKKCQNPTSTKAT